MPCVFYDIAISNDKDGRIGSAIVSVSATSAHKRAICATFFDESDNNDFRRTMLDSITLADKAKFNIDGDISKLTNEMIAKLNKNSVKKAINEYYRKIVKNVNNTNSQTNQQQLQGFSSITAKNQARSYTADLLLKIYREEYGNAESKAKERSNVINAVSNTVYRELLIRAISVAKEIYKDDGYSREQKELAKAFLESVKVAEEATKQRKEYFAKKDVLLKSYKEKHPDVNDRDAKVKVRQVLEKIDINYRTAITTRTQSCKNLINALGVEHTRLKNLNALDNIIVENPTDWFTQVYRLKSLSKVENAFKDKPLDDILFNYEAESEEDFNNIDNDDSINETAKTWVQTLISNFADGVADDVKLYLTSLYKLSAPFTRGSDLYAYDTDNELGVMVPMDVNFVIQQITALGPFGSVEDFKNKITEAATNIPELYGLGKLVNEMDKNPALANRLANELTNPIIKKIQIYVAQDSIVNAISNGNSNAASVILYKMAADARTNWKTAYDILDKDAIDDVVRSLNRNFEANKNAAAEKLFDLFSKYYPTSSLIGLRNLLNSSNATIKDFKLVADAISSTISAIDSVKDQLSIIGSEYSKKLKSYNELIEGGIYEDENGRPLKKPQADYSKVNYEAFVRNAPLITLSRLLSKYQVSDIKLNSFNAEGNMATDVIPTSRITNILKQIAYSTVNENGDEVKIGLNNLLKVVEKCSQYKYSPLFFGVKDANGKVIKEGLFKQTLRGYAVNDNAQDVLRVFLFDGIKNNLHNTAALYNDMSRGDYFASMLEAYFNPVNPYDYKESKDLNKRYGDSFLRIPSDAPKNFVAQLPRYDSTGLFKEDGSVNSSNEAFRAVRTILLGEINQAVDALNVVFEQQEVKPGILEIRNIKDLNKLYEHYHFKGKNVVANGKLTGRVFHFEKLFKTREGYDIHKSFGFDSLYGEDSTSLFQVIDDNTIKLNPKAVNWITINAQGKFVIDESMIGDLVDKISADWLVSFKKESDSRSKEFRDIIGDKYSENEIFEVAINDFINNNIFDDIFEGNPKFYKDTQSFLKRTKEAQASGKPYMSYSLEHTDDSGIRFLNEKPILSIIKLEKHADIVDVKEQTGFRAVTIYNTINASKRREAIKAEVKKINIEMNKMSEEEAEINAEAIASHYDEIKTNDAQSYITFEEWIRRRYADGTISQYKQLIDEILTARREERPINLEGINARIQVQKNFYYDLHYDKDLDLQIPRQIKNAEFVLIPEALPKGSDLWKLYNIMKDHHIDQINTAEADKAAKRNVLTFWKHDGTVDETFEQQLENDRGVNIYYYRYLYKQQDVPSHLVDKENKAGIQIMKKIVDNADFNRENIEKAVNNFFGAYSANIKESFDNFIEEMGWKIINDTICNVKGEPITKGDFAQFYERAVHTAEQQGLDSNFIDYLIPNEHGIPKMPNFMNNVSTKLESIAQSMFNNAIVRQKLPGWHAAQITNVGYDTKLKYHPEIKNEDGTVTQEAYAEIMLPKWFKNKFGLSDEELLKQLKAGKLDICLGYRIPTEGKQSVCKFKVVGFLNDVYDSTIMVPDEWVAQTGADFDVDSVYGITYEYYWDAETKTIHKVEHNIGTKEEDLRARYDDYLRRHGIDTSNTIEEDIRKKHLKSIDEFAELPVYEQLSREARNNLILDSMIEVLTDDSSKEENYASSNFDDITKVIKSYNAQAASRSPYNIYDQVDFRDNAMGGATLKAFSVSRDTFNSVCNRGKAVLGEAHIITVKYDFTELSEKDLENKVNELIARYGEKDVDEHGGYITIKHRNMAWSNDNRNVAGKIVTVYSSETTAHILDAIKEGAIKNENQYTFGTFKTLVDVGIDYDTAINFLIQPAVTLINKYWYANESVFSSNSGYPPFAAIKDIAIRAGLKLNGKQLNEYSTYKDCREAINNTPEIREALERLYGISKDTKFEDVQFVIDPKLLKQRRTKADDSTDFDDIAIDLATIITFKKVFTTTGNIEKLMRCSNPDKFGAKQTIRETREVINNVEKYSKGSSKIGNTILVNNKPILSELYGENSFYPYLNMFYQNVTKNSISVYEELFTLESVDFSKALDKFITKLGRKLTTDEYKTYKQYLVSSSYRYSRLLMNPITLDDRGFIAVDYERGLEYAEQGSQNDVASQEILRVYGINLGEGESFTIADVNRPTAEEIARFNKLSPAQKVNFIKAQFKDNAGIFSYLEAVVFNNTEFKRKGYTMNRITAIDGIYENDELIFQFDNAFSNSNPLVRLAAIDLIKYAFIVEGFNFRSGGISKIVANNSMLNFTDDGIENLIDQINDAITLYSNPEEYASVRFVENFIRSHSNITNRVVIKSKKGDSSASSLSGLWAATIQEEGLRIIPITEMFKPLINELKGSRQSIPTYFRINVKSGGKETKDILYKVALVTDDEIFMYPLNLLEANEYSDNSINNANNIYLSTTGYDVLIEEHKSGVNLRERYKTDEGRAALKNLKEKYKVAPLKFQRLKEVIDTPNAIETIIATTNDVIKKNQFTQFHRKLVNAVENPKGQYGFISYVGNQVLEAFEVGVPVNQELTLSDGTTEKVIITRVELNSKGNEYKYLRGYKNNKGVEVDSSILPVERIDALNDAIRGRSTSANSFFKVEVVTSEELKDDIDEARNIITDEFGEIDEDAMYSSTGEIEREASDIIENAFDPAVQLGKVMIDDILNKAGETTDTLVDNFKKRLYRDDVKIYSYASIAEHKSSIYFGARNYYKAVHDIIKRDIEQFETSTGEVFNIGDKALYEYLIIHPEDYARVIKTLLDAKTFCDKIGIIQDVHIDAEDNQDAKYLNEIKSLINDIKQNPLVRAGFKNIFDIYFAKKYSLNPVVKRNIVDLTENFGDISKMDLLFSDVSELTHKQIQTVSKYISAMLAEATQITAPKAVEAFEKRIKEITNGAKYDYNRIIDEGGKFIRPYTEKFIKDNRTYKDNVDNVRVTYGITSPEYVESKLAYDEWKSKNLQQEIVSEYYEADVKNRREVLNKAREEFFEYNSLINSLFEDGISDEESREIRFKIKSLLSNYKSDGHLKDAETVERLEALKAYIDKNRELKNKYFINEGTEEYNEKFEYYSKVVKDYDNANADKLLSEKLENDSYREAYEWLDKNASYDLVPELDRKLKDAYKKLGFKEDEYSFIQKLKLNESKYDKYGVFDGRKITEEERKTLEEGTQSERTSLIKDLGDREETLYNDEFYKLFDSDSDTVTADSRKQTIQVINKILSKCYDRTTKSIDIVKLSELDLEELHKLADAYKLLNSFNSGMSKAQAIKIKKFTSRNVNQEGFDEKMAYWRRNIQNTAKAGVIQNILTDHHYDKNLQYVNTVDEDGNVVPNRHLFSWIEPADDLKEKYTDTERMAARKFIRDNVSHVPTEYYYLAEREAKANGTYDEWFTKNHRYDSTTNEYVPISIWTTRKVLPTSEYAEPYVYNPRGDMNNRRVNTEYLNPEFKTNTMNYKADTGEYTNSKYTSLNSTDKEMLSFLQGVVNDYAFGKGTKQFIREGFAPRRYYAPADGDWVLDQALGILGLSMRKTTKSDWYDDFDYASDKEIDFDMLHVLRVKGYENEKTDYARLRGESDESYRARMNELNKENEAIRAKNLELEKKFIDRDWENVFRDFISKAAEIRAKQDVKNTMYLTLESLKDTKAYDVNWRGKVKLGEHTTRDNATYRTTSQDNAYDIFHNWCRRILYNQFHEPSRMRTAADIAQSMTSAKYMILNITGGIANINTGLTNIAGEQWARMYFSNESFLKANAIYMQNVLSFNAARGKETSNNKWVAFTKLFDVVDYDGFAERRPEENLKNLAKRIREDLYGFNSSGEHYMQNTVLFAMLASNKVYRNADGKLVIGTVSDMIREAEIKAMDLTIGENPAWQEAYKNYIISIKSDINKKKEFDAFGEDINRGFIRHLGNNKVMIDKYIKYREELTKKAKNDFKSLPTMESQFELKDGRMVLKSDALIDEHMFGEFRSKVISVNKKIHGVYDKLGSAYIEKNWWGGLVMQYHKHIYPGFMKRYRGMFGGGGFNEFRGTEEVGSYVSLAKFIAYEFNSEDYKSTKDNPMTAIGALQQFFRDCLDTVHNISTNWQLLPDWERQNIRRIYGDLCGMAASILVAILIHAMTDDDNLKDSNFLSTCVYLADRLYSESNMYTPTGAMVEFRTLYSSPLAVYNGPRDLIDAMGFIWQWATDSSFSINYESGIYKGENKAWVKVRRNIPAYRIADRLQHMAKNNKYYRIGDSSFNTRISKEIADWLVPDK